MANTDSAYFIPLYKFIVQNNIYVPNQQLHENFYNQNKYVLIF